MLTSAQKLLVKNDILNTPALNAFPNNPDGAFEIAAAYNALASPAYTVWKTRVTIGEVGKKFNGTELAGLSTLNNTRLQTLAVFLVDGVNPSLPDNRQFFDDIFSGAGGVTTRANLLALWKRLASRIEKLLATGTGSDASPAILGFEGTISYNDVHDARNS